MSRSRTVLTGMVVLGGLAGLLFRPTDAQDAQQTERLRRSLSRAVVGKALLLAERFIQEWDDALCLEGLLARMHRCTTDGADPYGELPELLDRLVRHPWRQMPGESTEAMLSRLQRELDADQSELVEQYKMLAGRFKQFSDGPWPLAWRSKSDHWLGLVQAVLRSKTAKDHSEAWRQRIKEDPGNATLYRMGYMAVVRRVRPGSIDFNVVGPLLQQDSRQLVDRFLWQARVLRTLAVAGVSVDDPNRSNLRERFLKELKAGALTRRDLAHHPAVAKALGDFFKRCDAESEARPLVQILVQAADPELFGWVSHAMGFSDQERRQLMLAKRIEVEAEHRPLNELIRDLRGRVDVPLWVSEGVLADDSKVSFRATAPWLVVMDRLLGKSDYRLTQLRPGLFWIGKLEDRPDAERTLMHGLLKSAPLSSRIANALNDSTGLEFEHIPLADLADYLEERHNIPIELIGNVAETTVTMNLNRLPLHLALTLLTKKIAADWDVFGNVVLVGKEHDLRRIRQLAEHRLRRKARLNQLGSPLAAALEASCRAEFIQTPLSDVIDYLQQQHRIRIERATDVDPAQPVTRTLTRLTLETVLDLLLFDLDLSWETDGKGIFIGSGDSVDAFRRRTTKPQPLP